MKDQKVFNLESLSKEELIRTNNKLNRRCGELERQVALMQRSLKSAIAQLRFNNERAYYYANELRSSCHTLRQERNPESRFSLVKSQVCGWIHSLK